MLWQINIKNRKVRSSIFFESRTFSVVQEGLEPSQAEPESEVLPLHHWTILFYFAAKMRIYLFRKKCFAPFFCQLNVFLHITSLG